MDSCRVTWEALPANVAKDTTQKLTCFVKLRDTMPAYRRQFIIEFDRDGATLFGAFPAVPVVRIPVSEQSNSKWTMSSDRFKHVSLPPPTTEIPILVWCSALKLPLLDAGVERQDIWTRIDTSVYAQAVSKVFRSSSILRRVARAYRWSDSLLGSGKVIGDASEASRGRLLKEVVTLVICGDLDSMTIMLARKDPDDAVNMKVVAQTKLQVVQWKNRISTEFAFDNAVFPTASEQEAVKTFLVDSVTLALSRAAVVYSIRKDLLARFDHLRPSAPPATCHCCGRGGLAMSVTAHICRRCHQGVFCLNCTKDNAYMVHHGRLCNDRYWCLGVDLVDDIDSSFLSTVDDVADCGRSTAADRPPPPTASSCRSLSVVVQK